VGESKGGGFGRCTSNLWGQPKNCEGKDVEGGMKPELTEKWVGVNRRKPRQPSQDL